MKTVRIFSVLILAAICFESALAAPVSICHTKFTDARTQADGHFQKRRYLLAAMNYAAASAVSCDANENAEAGLGYAASLALLGETDAALSEWQGIAGNQSIDRKYRERAQLQLVLLYDRIAVDAERSVQDAARVWRAKEDAGEFTAALRTSGFSESEKIRLADLRPRTEPVKSPWLAGVASILIPGAGQAYNGQFQTAAVAFVLNSIFLLSTIELAHHHLGFTAAISGIAFSTVYVGNITSAVNGAQSLNRAQKNADAEHLKAELTDVIEKN